MKIISPIVHREFLVRSRARTTYSMRWGLGLGALLIMTLMALNLGLLARRGLGDGAALFQTLTWFIWVYCLFEGVRHASDTLSEEKREGTLGLLFLTRMSGVEVVLGKLAACFTAGFFPMLGLTPLLAIFLLLGGVTGIEVFRVALALILTMVVSLSVSIWVSARSHHAGRAFGASLVMLVVWNLVAAVALARSGGQLWPLPAPYVLLRRSFSADYAVFPYSFWVLGGLLIVLSLCLVGLAGWRVHRRRADTVERVTKGTRWERWKQRRRKRSGGLKDREPIAWLVERHAVRDWLLWFSVPVLILSAVTSLMTGGLPVFGGFLALGVQGIVVWIGVQFLSGPHRTNQLELLLTVPSAMPQFRSQLNRVAIRVAKYGAVILGVNALVAWLIGLGLLFFASDASTQVPVRMGSVRMLMNGSENWYLFFLFQLFQEGVQILSSGFLLYATCWYALWRGAVAKSTVAALGRVVLVMIVGYSIVASMLMTMAMILMMTFSSQLAGGGLDQWSFGFVTVFCYGVLTIVFFLVARRSRRHFVRALIGLGRGQGLS